MTTFTKVKLEDIAEVIDSLHITPVYSTMGYPMVRVTDIKPGFLKTDNCLKVTKDIFLEFSRKHKAKQGDIVFSRVGSEGIVSLVAEDNEFCLGQNTAFIIPKERNNFLYYWLNSPTGIYEIKTKTTGATQRTVSLESIRTLNLSVPSIPEQENISSVLSSYDDLIENNEKRIKSLEEMAQLLYMEWFVKFKFPGHEKVKMVDSGTEYGKIPQGWEIESLLNSKIFLPCKDRIKKFEGKKLYFDTSCIDGIKITKEPLIVSWETIPSRAQFAPVYNSVWFARMSNTYKVLIFDKSSNFEVNNYLLSSGMLGLVTEEKYLGFLFALIKSEAFHKQKDSRATGATQVSLTDDGFTAIRILFPGFVLIEKYSNIVNGYIGQILALQKQNQNLSQTRDLLIPQLVTGKRELK